MGVKLEHYLGSDEQDMGLCAECQGLSGVSLGHSGEGRVAETRLCCLQALALP